MVIEKPQLFSERKDFLIFVFLMLSLILARLFFSYHTYQAFIAKPFYYTTATVLNAYPKSKDGKTYTVLKLQSEEGLTFFTTSYRDKPMKGKVLRLQLYPNDRITFWEYLGYFYVKSRIKQSEDIPEDTKGMLLNGVASQHSGKALSSFYQGIFFATPLPPELREKIAALGVSHLVALSGFHLGILWSVVYGLLLLLYRPLQKRYFPYRYSLLDLGVVTLLLLGFYVWFVGAPPSLLRSYVMMLVGWVVILLGIELLSFTFLTTVALLLLLLFPPLIASLSFWLSVIGVFYIFLLLRHASEVNGWIISLLFIPLGIFILMLPIVHGIFGMTTPYQLLSPLLSLLFIPFYPLVILLHLLGMGSLLDAGLVWLFSLPSDGVEKLLPVWATLVYMGLSLWAIWSRGAFGLLLVVAIGYGGYLFL
jgi:competence protein ComEC